MEETMKFTTGEYIDLGLPSGTLWAEQNEEGHYTFDEAKDKFGDNLPSIGLWDELREVCEWKWDKEKNGYTVTGPNGKSIFLPAAGYWDGTRLSCVGSYGYYWSSSLYTSCPYYNWLVYFNSSGVYGGSGDRYRRRSVRLVKQKENGVDIDKRETIVSPTWTVHDKCETVMTPPKWSIHFNKSICPSEYYCKFNVEFKDENGIENEFKDKNDMNNGIEIPFGAKDSELQGFEYTIPDGYTAEIKEGKVIVRKEDSEYEKTRKGILEIIDNLEPRHFAKTKKQDVIKWIERQSEEIDAEDSCIWSEHDEKMFSEVLKSYINFEADVRGHQHLSDNDIELLHQFAEEKIWLKGLVKRIKNYK